MLFTNFVVMEILSRSHLFSLTVNYKSEAIQQYWQSIFICNGVRVCVVISKKRLFPSEAVDKITPAVHTSPATKTYSKSAVAPKNGNVVPASTYKSPAAQNKPSFQPGALSGRLLHILTCLVSTLVFTTTFMVGVPLYIFFFQPTEGSVTFKITKPQL